MQEPRTIVLKADPREIKQARDFVALAFGTWGLDDYVARTVISELATNAVRHGSRDGDPVVVRAYRREDGVPVVEAWDRSDAPPVVRVAEDGGGDGDGAESGRGLLLMQMLVRSWGTRALAEGGKVVWAEIEPVPV